MHGRCDVMNYHVINPTSAVSFSIRVVLLTQAKAMEQENNNERGTKSGSGRGFASMDEERVREIASRGGKAAHAKGTAHEFTSDEAREAGRKGGKARANRSVMGQ
jgi:general stress protein YciG